MDSLYTTLLIVGVFMLIHYVFLTTQHKAKTTAMMTAQQLMLGAEKELSKEVDGAFKFQFVVDEGYNLLPQSIKLFVKKPEFERMVQFLFAEMKSTMKQFVDSDTPK